MSEQNTSHGKCLEYFLFSMEEGNRYHEFYMKIRMLITDLDKKLSIIGRRKEKKNGPRRCQDNKMMDFWNMTMKVGGRHSIIPISSGLLYIKFFYKNYSKYFERLIIDDCMRLYGHVRKILSTCTEVIKR